MGSHQFMPALSVHVFVIVLNKAGIIDWLLIMLKYTNRIGILTLYRILLN